jgi:hypothetical protein
MVALIASNMHFFAYTNICSNSNNFEISLVKHECSSDCCGTKCELQSEKKSCCAVESEEQTDDKDKCCRTNLITIDNDLVLQMTTSLPFFNAPVYFVREANNSEHLVSIRQESLAKTSQINIPPPKILNILELLSKRNISNDDDDYYC